jgi:hypothetical protein
MQPKVISLLRHKRMQGQKYIWRNKGKITSIQAYTGSFYFIDFGGLMLTVYYNKQ